MHVFINMGWQIPLPSAPSKCFTIGFAIGLLKSSSVCLSIRRPSLTFHIFDFFSETAEQNSTKLERKQDLNVLYQVFGPIGKTRWPPWPVIGWDIFDFSSETAERNSTKLIRKQDLNVLYQVCVFRADLKNNMAALASDWLRHFRLLLWNCWTEFNETWQEARSQRRLPSCIFRANQKNKMDALASDWLRHFQTSPLKPLNGIQWNLTWSKISTSSTKFVFFPEKQDGCPVLWLAETFSTSPLKLLNGIQRNVTGSKISTSSTKFVFFGPIGKIRWPPWPLIGWDIFNFSSETAERNSMKLDMKQDLNVLYQVCVFPGKTRWLPCPVIGWDIFDFSSETAERNSTKRDRKQDLNVVYQVCIFRANRKNKMAALASDWLRHFQLLLWNRWTEFNETWHEARSQRPLPNLCFSGRSEKQYGCPGLWLAESFSTSPLKPLNGIKRNLTVSKISMSFTKLVFSGRSENKNGRPGWFLKKVAHCTQVHDMWPFGPLVNILCCFT